MERKLARVEKIEWIRPIEDADQIELCGVLGWQCVITKKDKFKEGDKIIYIEVDSVLPEKPEFEFLRSRNFRIKTIKLKKQLSQGLVLPLPIEWKHYDIGTDLTENLGIVKYLSPSEQSELKREIDKIKLEKNKFKKFMMRYSWFRKLFLSRTKKLGFPYWVSKTDEERLQNIPYVLEQFKGRKCYITEKIDYQSVTFTGKMITRFNGILGKLLPKKYKFIVCSRNLVNNDKSSLYWKIAEKYKIEAILKKHPTLSIQGEQGDINVQKNKYKINEPTLWVFNIIDHENNYHFNDDEIVEFCSNNGLTPVPLISKEVISDTDVNNWIERSKGYSSLNKNTLREGIVVRVTENGKKDLSFKVINPDFLLKYDG